jgi:FKBP-type peptidyl-prolyl cis-trans isomerase
MHRSFGLLTAVLALLAAGCGPKAPPAPVVPEKTVEEQRREDYFGREIAADPDIKWRTSGLGIKVVTPGEGPAPQLTDRVRVHYVGRLKDGTVFDDSHPKGKPSDFPVNRLINGWAAAMPALKPGGKGVFYIPPHLGYGGLRAGNIPPFSGLIFEVELIAVNPEVPPKS